MSPFYSPATGTIPCAAMWFDTRTIGRLVWRAGYLEGPHDGWCAPTTPAKSAPPLPPAWPAGCAGTPNTLEEPPMINPHAWMPAVLAERRRQDTKWRGGPGDCSHPDTPDHQRLTVLMEEVGEVARAILDHQPDQLHAELVQVAAVAAAWLEGLHPSPTPQERTA